jgi:TPP-dependent pyruvate/acetoin dehydrogenase alpha subunit
VEAAKAADPIDRWRRFLLERDLAKEVELERIAGEIEAEMEEAVRFAEESPAPEASELCFDVVVEE